MRRIRLIVAFAMATLPAAASSTAQPSVTAQIERYMRGEHAAVVAELEALEDVDGVLEQLRAAVPAWIAAAPERERPARRLAAATFALEAARAARDVDWKHVRRLRAEGNELEGADRIFWKSPPLLIEWGCALLRMQGPPAPSERIWHLAALAVADRASDFEFLIGSPWEERMNAADEIDHLDHSTKRFPREARFALATGIAVEWATWSGARGFVRPRQADAAIKVFEGLFRDDAVGGEANVRAGAIHARANRLEDALEAFSRAERATRDRYVVYLARYFKGHALDRAGRTADAEAAWRGALAVIPQAQSATLALAGVLAKQGRRSEAGALVEAQLSTRPQPPDPWRDYAAADDRFWPELIAQLRAEIKR